MSSSTVGSCRMGRGSRHRVIWCFGPGDSPTGGHMDVSLWRRSGQVDGMVGATRVRVSAKRRDLRSAARLAAIAELRRLARWATERAEAMVEEDGRETSSGAKRRKAQEGRG